MIVLQRSAASRSPLPATTTISVSSSIVEHRMLTNLAVKAARPRAAAYKLTDGGGLHLYVAPTPRWTWRWRFRIAGKEQLLTLGSWPEMSLDQARAARDQARERLDRGEDPREVGTGDDPRLRAFEYVGRRWHAHMQPRWTPVHARDVMASLERDVFPAIGAMPIEGITVPVVLNALRVIQERGSLETSHRVRQRISAVFCYAMADGLVDKDPAAIVGKVLAPPAPTRHKAALIEIDDVRALLAAADRIAGAGDVIVQASRFLALTAVRLAAMRGARWEEIENLDGPMPQACAGGTDEARGSEEAGSGERPYRAAIAAGGGAAASHACKFALWRCRSARPDLRGPAWPDDKRGRDRRALQSRGLRRPTCAAWLARQLFDDPQ
jgi:hypothetical protein